MAKWAAVTVLLLVAAAMAAPAPAAAQCNAGQLAGGAGARGYARNPAYASYINSGNARKTLSSCGIAIPRC
uniref:Bifunctional inhibitor/plant lipid transfer protein/seed storage helical domain-containing protein n=1 Tax=Oryza brachyantha TaxID=4533 RepID=J3N3X3_ORYBR